MDENFILRDDLDQDTRKNTSVHIPNGEADQSMMSKTRGNDKREGNGISFEETFDFILNVPKHVRSTRRNVYIALQILEVNKSQINGENSMIKGSNYQIRGWYLHKVNLANGQVSVGTFDEYIYSPPQKKPPFDPSSALTLSQTIEFTVEELTGTRTRKM